MEPTTKALLRNAILEAVTAEQDVAAMELMALLTGTTAAPKPAVALALPASKEVTEGPAHDYHYWMRFIREQFIPFMSANGRLRFTSHELLTWIENCPALSLTSGDIDQFANGREVWRNGVSAALSSMKQQGLLKAPAFGKDYEIMRPALAGTTC